MVAIVEHFKRKFDKNYILTSSSPISFRSDRELINKSIKSLFDQGVVNTESLSELLSLIDEKIILENLNNLNSTDNIFSIIKPYDLLQIDLPEIFYKSEAIPLWVKIINNSEYCATETMKKIPDEIKYDKDIINAFYKQRLDSFIQSGNLNYFYNSLYLDESKVDSKIISNYKLPFIENQLKNKISIDKEILNSQFFMDNFKSIMNIFKELNYTTAEMVNIIKVNPNYKELLRNTSMYFKLLDDRNAYNNLEKESMPLDVLDELEQMNPFAFDMVEGLNDDFITFFKNKQIAKIMVNVINIASKYPNLSEFIGCFITKFNASCFDSLRQDLISNIDILNESDYEILFNLFKSKINIISKPINDFEINSLVELRNIDIIKNDYYNNALLANNLDNIKNILLINNYNLDLSSAKYMLSIYKNGILEMDNNPELIKAINTVDAIVNASSKDELTRMNIEEYNNLYDSISAFYSSIYSVHNYGILEDTKEIVNINGQNVSIAETDGNIYGVGRMIFNYEGINSFEYWNSNIGSGSGNLQYRKEVCCSFLTQDRLEEGNVYMLFGDISDYTIPFISNCDAHSSMVSSARVDKRDEKGHYISPKELLAESGNMNSKSDNLNFHNELIVDKLSGKGEMSPKYIMYYGKKDDDNYNYAIKAASEFGIDVIFADQDKIQLYNRNNLIKQYEKYKNITVMTNMSKNTFLDVQIFLKNLNIYNIKNPETPLNFDNEIIERLKTEFGDKKYSDIDEIRNGITHSISNDLLMSSYITVFEKETNDYLSNFNMSFALNNESAVVTLQDNREITIDYNQTLSMEENIRMIQDSINNIVNEIMQSLSNEGIKL